MANQQDPRADAIVQRLIEKKVGQPEQREAMVRLAQDRLGAFSRDEMHPGHFTASAFVLSPDRKKLLLISHRKLKMWLQPGGHMDPDDEDWVAAAARELREETGQLSQELLDSLFDIDIHRIPALGDAPAHLHYDLRVLFGARQLDLSLQEEEVADAHWFELTELAANRGALLHGLSTDASVRSVAQRLLEVHPEGA